MEKNIFKEILTMIEIACKRIFDDGVDNKEDTILQCATQIYIAQMTKGS